MAGLEKLVGFTGAAALGISSIASASNILYVSGSGGVGPNGETVYSSLHQALVDAPVVGASKIYVAEGVYVPEEPFSATPDDMRSAAFTLPSGVHLYGGFPQDSWDLADRCGETNPTRLSGDQNGDDGPNFTNRDDNSYNVLRVMTNNTDTSLDGFVVEGGHANGSLSLYKWGGGLINLGSPISIANTIFTDNYAHERGGAVYTTGSPTFENVTFTGNESLRGGAVAHYGSGESLFDGCTFVDNHGLLGGAIYATASTANTKVNVNNSTFNNNTATSTGGAIAVETGARFAIDGSTFYGNNASAGGAIDTWNILSSSIKNSTLSNNSANQGGAIWTGVSSAPAQDVLTLENSILDENTASESGGAIYSRNKRDIIINTQITGNSAPAGSAIFNWRNSGTGGLSNAPVILSSTIADNTGSAAIRAESHPFTMYNTIVFNNDGAFSLWSASPQVKYSTIQGGFTGEGNITNTPLFNGPNDYRLLQHCSSVDSGNNALADGIEFDIIGDPRIQSNNGNPTPIINRGAYETAIEPQQPSCPADLTGDGVVNVSDLLQLLSAWGPNVGHPADLNGDGVVNVSDLLILLGQWGPCPVQINGGVFNPETGRFTAEHRRR